LIQTLYAEYPALKPHIEKLRGKKAEHTVETLKSLLWGLDDAHTVQLIEKFRSVGFVERRTDKGTTTYRVPFLYRDALGLIQGKAE